MSAGTLLRLSGLAGIVAGVVIILSEILAMAVGLMDMATMARTPLSPAWIPLNLLQLFGVILLLLALVGFYARQAAVAGGFGLVRLSGRLSRYGHVRGGGLVQCL